MLITTVSAPVQPCQAKGGDDESIPEEPSQSAGPLDTVRSDHVYHNGGISKEFTVQQKVGKTPELLTRPSDNETWRRYIVLAHQIEPLLPWFKEIPSIHIAGTTSNHKYYDVVICDSCVRCLHHVGCAFEFGAETPPPTDGPLSRWVSWAFFPVQILLDCLQPWFCHISCTFELRSEDGSVDVAPTESTAPDEFVHVDPTDRNNSSELVHVESTEFHKPHELVHVGPTESAESDEFVRVKRPDASLSTESASANKPIESFKPAKPVNYKDTVSVTGKIVFVEFERFDQSSEILHYDVSQPEQGEINVHGILKAKRIAENRFITKAIDAISSAKHGQGLDRYYLSSRHYYNAHGLSLAIEWAILLRDIKSSKQGVIRQFFRHCLFITLHTLNNPEMACNSGFASWTDAQWLSFFEEVLKTRWKSRSTEDMKAALSVLQAVFASARDGAGPRSDAFRRTYSDQGHVEKLSSLFFDDTELEIAPFGDLEPALLERCLRKFKIFEDCEELDVAQFTEGGRLVPLFG